MTRDKRKWKCKRIFNLFWAYIGKSKDFRPCTRFDWALEAGFSRSENENEMVDPSLLNSHLDLLACGSKFDLFNFIFSACYFLLLRHRLKPGSVLTEAEMNGGKFEILPFNQDFFLFLFLSLVFFYNSSLVKIK